MELWQSTSCQDNSDEQRMTDECEKLCCSMLPTMMKHRCL